MQILILRNGEQQGPYSEDEVRQYLAQGSFLPTDLAWHEGLDGWVALREIIGAPKFKVPPPPPPLVTSPSPDRKRSQIQPILVLVGLALLATYYFASKHNTTPVAGQPWTNSLGVKFVPAGTDAVLFSVWDVRVKDFKAFVDATGYDATGGMISVGSDGLKHRGDTWKSPGFTQTEDHPVVGVSWDDAHAFCQWLTKKEQAEGKLAFNQQYRLPTDAEWSKAVGLNESSEGTPGSKSMQIKDVYPWGIQWPPLSGAGNYAGSETRDAKSPGDFPTIDGYSDGYARTSPVGSFSANQYGLYDMGGNVWQWCEDKYDSEHDWRVLRGASCGDNEPAGLLSSFRANFAPGFRNDASGFRVVVVCSH